MISAFKNRVASLSFGQWAEILFFYFVLIFNLGIVFGTKYFPTFDGGAHAYNANIIYKLLTDNDTIYKDYFQFNSELVPNWTSYVLLFVFRSFLSYGAAEKAILLLFFALTPVLFRSVIKRFSSHNILLSYLIFPFTHFSLLYMGFFNFTLGIMFFFLFIHVYLGLEEKVSIKRMILFFVILSAVFFSHIFVFIAAVILMAVHSGGYLIANYTSIKEQKFRWVINRAINLLAPSALFLYLTISYFVKRPSMGMETFLKVEDINLFFLEVRPIQAFGAAETPNGVGLFWIIYTLIILTLGKRVFTFNKETGIKSFFKLNDVFLVLALMFVYFTYTQPNEDGYGGFISIRLALFTYFFILLWLASFNIGVKLTLFIMPFYFYFSYRGLRIKKESMAFLNDQVKKIDVCAEKIEPNKTLVPFYFADYLWQGLHYCNYLGGEKDVVILNNYEATVGYFPIIWNGDKLPEVVIGNLKSENVCQKWESRPRPVQKKADYVLMFGEKPGDKCYDDLIRVVWENYVAVARDHDVTLYKLRN